jgi:glutathione synthase/RimK-type ligase-like ATP-grasp enzyme
MRLKFGPLFGILINHMPAENQGQTLGPLTKFLDECVLASSTKGIAVVVFQPQHIQLEKREVTGWAKERGKWTSATFPYPDIIYNRIMSRRIEELPAVQAKLNKLSKHHNIPIFNERFLDKGQVHAILQKDEAIAHLLPYTVPFNLKRVKEAFTHYPILYLKPTNGSLGSGIIRLTRSNKIYLYQYATANGSITRTARSFVQLGKILTQKIKQQPYIIQQGLVLVTFDKRPVDFRVLLQKNRQGKWSVTSTVARIANDRQIVSNLARGGTLRKVPELLAELKLRTKPSSQEIRQRALTIAHSFERHANGHFAELGIDLALDTNGRIWLLEINSKPSKTDDSVLNQGGKIRPSVSKLLDYVHHLAGIEHTVPKARRKRR